MQLNLVKALNRLKQWKNVAPMAYTYTPWKTSLATSVQVNTIQHALSIITILPMICPASYAVPLWYTLLFIMHQLQPSTSLWLAHMQNFAAKGMDGKIYVSNEFF